jgi:hypothetical protein
MEGDTAVMADKTSILSRREQLYGNLLNVHGIISLLLEAKVAIVK